MYRDGSYLRLIELATEQPLLRPAELDHARRTAEAQARAAEAQARDEAEARPPPRKRSNDYAPSLPAC
jgi:hypothetical protein